MEICTGSGKTVIQAKGELMSNMLADVKAFELKLHLFQQQASESNFCHFHCHESVAGDTSTPLPAQELCQISRDLKREFEVRFPDSPQHLSSMRFFQKPF